MAQNLSEEEIRRIVRTEIRQYFTEALGLSSAVDQPQKEWYSTKEAWELLNLPSQRSLRELVYNGVFQSRKHYRIINPGAKNKHYQFNLKACSDRLLENPAKYLKPKK